MRLLALGATATFLLLAGCSGDPPMADGQLAYEGTSPGSHQSSRACASSVDLHWEGDLGSGLVDVRLLDGEGVQRISILYSKSAPASASQPATGIAGEWTLQAERRADASDGTWSGHYELHLSC